jgi:hypothetical protein
MTNSVEFVNFTYGSDGLPVTLLTCTSQISVEGNQGSSLHTPQVSIQQQAILIKVVRLAV